MAGFETWRDFDHTVCFSWSMHCVVKPEASGRVGKKYNKIHPLVKTPDIHEINPHAKLRGSKGLCHGILFLKAYIGTFKIIPVTRFIQRP
jgi:hypothetical protein